MLSRAIFAIRGEGILGKINGKKCEKQNFPQRRVAIRIGNEGRNSKERKIWLWKPKLLIKRSAIKAETIEKSAIKAEIKTTTTN